MDATSIIITIGAVMAGLFLLWVIVMAIFALIARSTFARFNRKAEQEREAWRKRHGFF